MVTDQVQKWIVTHKLLRLIDRVGITSRLKLLHKLQATQLVSCGELIGGMVTRLDDNAYLFDPRRDVLLNNRVGVAKLTYLVLL